MAHESISSTASRLSLQSRWVASGKHFFLIGAVVVAGLMASILHAALVQQGWRRFLLAYLVAFAFVLSISLGGLFFVLIQHLARARWSVLIRRMAEVLAANLLLVAALFIPIGVTLALGVGHIYPWADGHTPGHAAPETGSAYLNVSFFLGRWAVFLTLWAAMGLFFWRSSLRQDATRDHLLTRRMEKLAAPAALLAGVTITLAAFDLLMSLTPHWYSTIFGIYFLSGGIVGGLASMIILILALQRAGILTRAIGYPHHLDLGRLLFAFLFFWAYIAFSQYMLLWYANIPETTIWLRERGATTVSADINGWSYVVVALLLGHFLIPFAALMSRHVKSRPRFLALGAVWMLIMHWLDLVWVVMPSMGTELRLGFVEIGLGVALAGLYTMGVLRLLSIGSLVPLGDPRLGDSVIHETVY